MEERLRRFREYAWDQDSQWKSYMENITIPNPEQQETMVAKLKFKYYKRNIDPEIEEVSGESKPASISSHSIFTPILDVFPAGPLSCNCSIFADKESKEGILVDPGGSPDLISQKLKSLDVKIKYILITHAHFDHFLAADIIKNQTGAQVVLHKDDLPLWAILDLQCSMFGTKSLGPVSTPGWLLNGGEEIHVNQNIHGKALHTPGHSPGSTCFLFESAKVLFSGDTIFKGSVGRTDLWGGNKAALAESIKSKLFPLNDETLVVAGHGPNTTIGYEKQFNHFMRPNI